MLDVVSHHATTSTSRRQLDLCNKSAHPHTHASSASTDQVLTRGFRHNVCSTFVLPSINDGITRDKQILARRSDLSVILDTLRVYNLPLKIDSLFFFFSQEIDTSTNETGYQEDIPP